MYVSVCLLLCLCLSLLDSRPEADLPLGPLAPTPPYWVMGIHPRGRKERILLHRARILELVPRDSLLEKSQVRWGFTRRPRTDFTSHPGTRTHTAPSKLSEHRGSPHKMRKQESGTRGPQEALSSPQPGAASKPVPGEVGWATKSAAEVRRRVKASDCWQYHPLNLAMCAQNHQGLLKSRPTAPRFRSTNCIRVCFLKCCDSHVQPSSSNCRTG